MRAVIAGGSGLLGQLVAAALLERGDEVTILTRRRAWQGLGRTVLWNPAAPDSWRQELEGADLYLHLASGRLPRFHTEAERPALLAERLASTAAVCAVMPTLSRPPRVWMHGSSADIYAHNLGLPAGETLGLFGGGEPGSVPAWDLGADLPYTMERMVNDTALAGVRRIALRTAFVMEPSATGYYALLRRIGCELYRGDFGDGRAHVSWISARDFVRSVLFLADHAEASGPFNLVSPGCLAGADFFGVMRALDGVQPGYTLKPWMLELAARWKRYDTGLVLKSRKVSPERLTELGFTFSDREWSLLAATLRDATAAGGSES